MPSTQNNASGTPNLDALRAQAGSPAPTTETGDKAAPAKAKGSKAAPKADAKAKPAAAEKPADSATADAKAKPAAKAKSDAAPAPKADAAVTVAPKTARSTKYLAPAQIKIDPDLNLRNMDSPETKEHVDNLKADIAIHGLINPITVFTKDGDSFFYVDKGHCRFAAIQQLISDGQPIEKIEVFIADKRSTPEMRVLEQVTENSSLRFSPVEQGLVFQKLINVFKWDVEKVAKEVSRSTTHVTNLVDLVTQTPTVVLDKVKEGKISGSEALRVVKDVGADKAPAVVDKAIEIAGGKGKEAATGKHVSEAIATVGAPVREKKTRKSSGSGRTAPHRKPDAAPAGDPTNLTRDGVIRLMRELMGDKSFSVKPSLMEQGRMDVAFTVDKDIFDKASDILFPN